MWLQFVFLPALSVSAWLRLSRRSSVWKDAEILLLCHQIALLERRSTARPKLTWADRVLFAALLAVIPRVRHAGLRLRVTPATILRRHATITRLVLRMAGDNESWG
jgi:putative transposase